MRGAALTLAPLLAVLLALAGCGFAPTKGDVSTTAPAQRPARLDPSLPQLPAAGSGRGGYYKDDGPGDNPPPDLASVPDAEVKLEAPLPRANRPYVVFGKTYTPIANDQPYTQTGYASWYGKKFQGQRTSSGERYDMYKMTAAHPTLPIPSFVRLTDVASGKQVIVRINDRGPFHGDRIIDISYTAALKLGMLEKGSHQLKLERLLPDEIARMQAAEKQGTAVVAAAAPAAAAVVVPVAAPAPAPVIPASAAPDGAAVPVELASQGVTTPTTGAVDAPQTTALVLPNVAVAGERATDQQLDAAKGGVFLQLGAYSRAENAETARVALAPYAGRLGVLQVVQAGPIYRLYSGPFESRLEANQAAAALPGSLRLKPIAVLR